MKLFARPRILATLVTLWFTFSVAPGIFVEQQAARGAAPPLSQPDSQALLSTADSILGEMSQITGWPIRSPLKKQVVSRAEVQNYLTENIHYQLDSGCLQGLKLFYQYAAEIGALNTSDDLKFVESVRAAV